MEYENRRGERYFVLQGTTKTGKPKYYCSKKSDGTAVDRLPPEFELFENPATAIVTVRKVKPSRIRDDEVEFLKSETHRLSRTKYFLVNRDGDHLVIHASDIDIDSNGLTNMLDSLGKLTGLNLFRTVGVPTTNARQSQIDTIVSHGRYSPVFRVTLTDADKRLFGIEHWCDRGSIEDWISLTDDQTLATLTKKYLPHLGEPSFFNLM